MTEAFIIDASATLAWAFDEDGKQAAFRPLIRDGILHAPRLWRLEVANTLVMKHRRGIIDAGQLETLVDLLGQLEVAFAADAPLDALVSVSEGHRLTAYDAAYLELAMRFRLPLLTVDQEMAKAAAAAGVSLLAAAAAAV